MSTQTTKDPDALPQLVGDFKPVDEWQGHINRLFYALRGSRIREFYQTFAVADYRLAYALADDYWQQCQKRANAQPSNGNPETLTVMEWGSGNGNLAACFLDRLQARDKDNQFYDRVRYVCVESEPTVMAQAQANTDLKKHADRVTFTLGSVEDLAEVADGSVDRIICNELWSELPTKLILRKESDLKEEHLRPNLTESRLTDFPDWPAFIEAFSNQDVETLRTLPQFLEDLVWEREFHPIDSKAFPFRKTVAEVLKAIDEEVLVPFNVGACQSVKEAMRILAPDAIGFSCFDAGTADPRVLNDPEKPCYTVQGGQFSFMVNFQLIGEIAKHLGISSVHQETQREFVGRSLGTNVLSVMDVLASHPYPPQGDSWQVDRFILQTLGAINRTYHSPYEREINYPIAETIPEKERGELTQLVKALHKEGVPDTIAYLTEEEIWKAMPELRKMGYEDEGMKMVLQMPPQPVDYTHFNFRPHAAG